MWQKLALLTAIIACHNSLTSADSVYLGQLQADVFGVLPTHEFSNESYADVYWVVTAPTGFNVYVQIISLQLSDGDFVAAYDGNQVNDQNVIQSLNGVAKYPNSFVSSFTNVTIRFAGNPSKSKFRLTYTLPTTSSTMLQTNGSFQTFTSPGFPNNYGNNLDYIWVLYAPSHYVIEIMFNTFRTEQNADFFVIYDGDSTFVPYDVEYSGDYTSNFTDYIFTSTSNYLTLRFTSSSSNQNSGFIINYASYKGGETLTTVPPPPISSTAVPPGAYCSGNGNYTCNCNHGYTGQHCESEIDFCSQYIDDYQGGLIQAGQLCQPHGTCTSSPQGATCTCSRGFTGQFCENEIPNETAITSRCSLYATNFTISNQVPIGCPSQQQVCIPDHMNCAVYGSCTNPLGWCIPSATGAAAYMTELISLLNSNNLLYKLF